jgi:hypothetical protein
MDDVSEGMRAKPWNELRLTWSVDLLIDITCKPKRYS